jgi:methyl-accepting chemotaxis protein
MSSNACSSQRGVIVFGAAQVRVRTQLSLVFAIVIAISFLSTGLALWRLQALSADTRELTTQPLVKERLLSEWLLQISMAVKRTSVLARASDPDLAPYFAADAKESSARSSGLQAKFKEMITSSEEQALFDDIAELRKHYVSDRDRVLQLKLDGKHDEALALYTSGFMPHAQQYTARVNDLLAYERRAIDTRASEVLDNAHRSQTTLVILSLATLAVSIVAGSLFVRSLFRRLGGEPALAAQVAAEIAAGNLDVDVPVASGDGQSLMAAMQTMRDSLKQLVGRVHRSADVINGSAASIAAEAQDLSTRTERQAAALEETASSMEELTRTVGHNTDNARQASKLAGEATDVARQGGQMVEHLVTTMGSIDESAKRIADIIGVIDGIAFQTNILALNAAVEAARAGEQGRGFAVVASEVRALAQRSASAAKEIKELIEDSTRRVEQGAAQARRTGDTMGGIVAGIERVAVIMGDIVTSSREQADGIVQVNQTVAQMDQATQQNAALVEEAAAAADAMQQEVAQLAHTLAAFRVERSQRGGAARPAVRAPGGAIPRALAA